MHVGIIQHDLPPPAQAAAVIRLALDEAVHDAAAEIVNAHLACTAILTKELRQQTAQLEETIKAGADAVVAALGNLGDRIAGELIETKAVPAVAEKVHASMLEELSLEDRINDEVRVILEAFQDDMRKTGASYPEMFKKVKNELARKYKAVL